MQITRQLWNELLQQLKSPDAEVRILALNIILANCLQIKNILGKWEQVQELYHRKHGWSKLHDDFTKIDIINYKKFLKVSKLNTYFQPSKNK